MTVCNFFLQGRCRYGDKCWNEHPRGGNRGGGGGGGGYNDSYNRSSGQQSRGGGGGGGFGNRVWVNPSQQKGGYIQPSSFSSHGSNDWGRGGDGGGGGGGGGRRDNVKSSDFSFSSQNRFSALNSPSTFDSRRRGGGGGGGGVVGDEDDDKKLEVIQVDMEIWDTSGQWSFSCYSNHKTCLSGFTDLSPEELRLEYYTARASGDVQPYVNGVIQLFSQWKNRLQELKNMNQSTRAAVLAELSGAAPQASAGGFGSSSGTGFGSSTSGFGSKGFGAPEAPHASSFSFASSSSGFGSAAAAPSSSSSSVFGSALAAPAQPPSGFGGPAAPSASTFSFASTGGGFGSGFGAPPPAAAAGGSSSVFGLTSGGGFGAAPAAAAAPPAAAAGGPSDSLFSTVDKLSEEELAQFKAKRFTLGQIPLKPPPADLLTV